MKENVHPASLKVNISRLKDAQTVAPENYYLPVYRNPVLLETLRKAIVPSVGGVFCGTIGAIAGGP